MPYIKTDELSNELRERSIRLQSKEVLISRLAGSAQEADLSEPPNCEGFGRIRHFRMRTPEPWPRNPLPMMPAASRLGRSVDEVSNAQVFQNASCNWRCWYCYVPFNLLAANAQQADWLTADQMVALYSRQAERPLVIDCSGGQPDLVPEWIPWMMEALEQRGLGDSVYLWSDDNLSNDYFWRYLSDEQQRRVSTYRNYGRVCCFKGYDAQSFAFNTRADPSLFDRQFDLFKALLTTNIDLYAYATFTSPEPRGVECAMAIFVDRLQALHKYLPLRLVPLRIESYGVVEPRVHASERLALKVQVAAIEAWNNELMARFSPPERALSISDVSLWE
jgi:uncharacterized Fe-S cluster-containing radical SAM superfamily protein